MTDDLATTPTLARLRRARAQHETVRRLMRPVGALVLASVVITSAQSHTGPGLSGHGLAVSVSLGAFVVGGAGAWVTRRRPDWVPMVFAALLFVTSAALVWLQPDGTGYFGLFIAVMLLARRLPGRIAIGAAVFTGAFLFAMVAVEGTSSGGGRRSAISAVGAGVAIAAVFGITVVARRLREANEQAERLVIELDRARDAEAVAATLAERQRLAREMHDVLAHSLSGLLLHLEGARLLAAEDPSDPRIPETIERAHRLAKTGLDEARRAIGMLHDDDLPGPERLARLTAEFEQSRGVPCHFTTTGEPQALGSEARLALYRVAQEALTNIAKHAAQPERVEVRLSYEPQGTRLTVEDFSGADVVTGGVSAGLLGASGGGYGLTGMRERAELLGGELTTAATDGGFRVDLQVPS